MCGYKGEVYERIPAAHCLLYTTCCYRFTVSFGIFHRALQLMFDAIGFCSAFVMSVGT